MNEENPGAIVSKHVGFSASQQVAPGYLFPCFGAPSQRQWPVALPLRGDRRNSSLHEQDRQGLQIDRPAPRSGTGFARGQGAVSLSRHRQQSRR